MLQLDTFVIENVVIHDIPKVKNKDKEEHPLELSETTIVLNNALKGFFRERVQVSMKRSFDAVYKTPAEPLPGEEAVAVAVQDSEVPAQVAAYFAEDMQNLVAVSQTIARELYRFQSGTPSEGLLVTIDARIVAGPDLGAVLVVLKLENDEALLVTKVQRDGLSTFAARLQTVTLPKSSKVFKAAIFPRAATLAEVRAQVSDNQHDKNSHGEEVADFFLRFLGCRLRDSPDRATKAFLEAAEAFVDTLDDDAAKVRVLNAALTEIESQSGIIDPTLFAHTALEPDERDAFLATLPHAADGTVPVITKDLALLGDRIKRISLEFEGGVRVTGPRDAIGAVVQTEDGWLIGSPLKRAVHGGR